ncbi:3-oxoacyl-ACP reductase FabG [Cognatiluteimonas telluris]|uniref:3-oxoacyl-ACP reductase FabG n=1 Tax=Cognatiluteimonas telluris TaxID=1104775 RepID=UPI00140994B0|nr:3-oxoacyl-ACP reductase FabG [Lysobacter telluris]
MNAASGTNRWILVTGGARGIGLGLVTAFAKAGFEVVFTYKSSADSARQAEESMAAQGFSVSGHACDSTDEAAVQALSAQLLTQRGAPYAIVNNAGITRDSLMMNMSTEDWRSVIDTNLNSAFFITRAFTSSMLESGDGVVLQISSVAAHKGIAGQTNYSATKAALTALTRSLALELGRFNVRVNAIAPGYIATDMFDNIPEAQRKSIRNSVPLRRIGTVEDVASLALFLLDPSASYITGQTFVVDGGLTA